jgi:hypothetical protein
MQTKYPDTVEEAAKLLDWLKSNWAEEINIKTLNMAECDSCILGQLYRTYGKGFDVVFGRNSYSDEYQHDEIFGMNAPVSEWIDQIRLRLNKGNWTWAVEQLAAGKKVRQKNWMLGYYYEKLGDSIILYDNTNKIVRDSRIQLSYFTATNWELYAPELKLSNLGKGQKFKFHARVENEDKVYTFVQDVGTVGKYKHLFMYDNELFGQNHDEVVTLVKE